MIFKKNCPKHYVAQNKDNYMKVLELTWTCLQNGDHDW